MRPRVLYELSRHLAVLLEHGLAGERGARIPVFVCHPLDVLQDAEPYRKQAAAVLYPFSVVPEERFRPAGWSAQVTAEREGGRAVPEPADEELVYPPLWVRVRYVVLLVGGTIEEQLEALAAALRTLHEHGSVTWDSLQRDDGAPERDGKDPPPPAPVAGEEGGSLPLRLLGDIGAWRELGLSAHHLTIAFEVSVPIPASRTERASRVVERDVQLEEEIP
jgi:hypothetical protein